MSTADSDLFAQRESVDSKSLFKAPLSYGLKISKTDQEK